MKLAIVQQTPAQYSQPVLQAIFRALETQGNLLAEGRLSGRHFNATTVPTTGTFAKGDLVWESNPTVVGSVVAGVAADYIRLGWICTASGSPGTLKELRIPVGSGSGVSSPLSASPITASLGADVSLNNTSNFFDGPSVAQGSTGTWFVSGTVTCSDSTGTATFTAKLWDGTTTIATAVCVSNGATFVAMSLSGYLASPAGNLRISVKDNNFTTGKILSSASGSGKDSTITAFRIA